MKKQIKILTLFFLSLFIISCERDSQNEPLCCVGDSIVDLATQSDDLSTLVSALQITGLDEALTGQGPYSVLAPNNDAFASFLTDLNVTSLNDVPVDVLTNLLLNHVIFGEVPSSSLSNGYANTQAISSASGTNMSIYINTDNGVNFNGVSNVLIADVFASNGSPRKRPSGPSRSSGPRK